MTKRGRHAAEVLIVAAVLTLAAFIGRELWTRRGPAAATPPQALPSSAALEPTFVDYGAQMRAKRGGGQTETAVSRVPAVKLTRVQRRKAPAAGVPAPR